MPTPNEYVAALDRLQDFIDREWKQKFNPADTAFLLNQMAWTYHNSFNKTTPPKRMAGLP